MDAPKIRLELDSIEASSFMLIMTHSFSSIIYKIETLEAIKKTPLDERDPQILDKHIDEALGSLRFLCKRNEAYMLKLQNFIRKCDNNPISKPQWNKQPS